MRFLIFLFTLFLVACSEYPEMEMDIYYHVEPFDDKNEDHLETLKEQKGVPFEI